MPYNMGLQSVPQVFIKASPHNSPCSRYCGYSSDDNRQNPSPQELTCSWRGWGEGEGAAGIGEANRNIIKVLFWMVISNVERYSRVRAWGTPENSETQRNSPDKRKKCSKAWEKENLTFLLSLVKCLSTCIGQHVIFFSPT